MMIYAGRWDGVSGGGKRVPKAVLGDYPTCVMFKLSFTGCCCLSSDDSFLKSMPSNALALAAFYDSSSFLRNS